MVGSWGILLDAADSRAGVWGPPPRKMGLAADLKPNARRGLWIELFRIVGFLLACSLGLVRLCR